MDAVRGHLSKMKVAAGEPITYHLPLDTLLLPLNPLLGQEIELFFEGVIHCVACGRKIRKTYRQGYCFPCTRVLAECDFCIVRPETCHYHYGTCRQPDWGRAHCMQTHYVYLANSTGLKVGITRDVNIPSRWIDQGASQALPIVKVGNRLQSGWFEVLFKEHLADRTDWRKMLRKEPAPLDLAAKRDALFAQSEEGLDSLMKRLDPKASLLEDETAVTLHYPILRYPTRLKSLDFQKTPRIQGTLWGIKGQYLMLSSGVLNIRKFTGYEIQYSA